MKNYSIYLSTLSSISPPINKTDLAYVKWNVNWNELFGGLKGTCRVRAKLVSSSAAAGGFTSALNTGSLHASFQSNTSKLTNGFNIGLIKPSIDSITAANIFLELDTASSNGSSIVVPSGNGDFYITFLDRTEALMGNVQEYQLWLMFDCDIIDDDE